MSSQTQEPAEIVFRGIDGTECEEFIAAVEDLAFREGWSEDSKRMLLFARSRLRHKALRWFATLDPSKKADWDLFVGALFDQYPLVEASHEQDTATPVWSATTFSPGNLATALPEAVGESLIRSSQATQLFSPPNKAYNSSLLGRHIGTLRIIADGESTPPQYVWKGRRDIRLWRFISGGTPCSISYGTEPLDVTQESLSVTLDRQEALIVCFLDSTKPHMMSCLNTTHHLKDLNVIPSYQYTPSDSDVPGWQLHCSTISGNGGYANVWNVLADGTVQITVPELEARSYPRKGTAQWTTTEIHLDTSGSEIRFVKIGTTLGQDYNEGKGLTSRVEVRARLVFEPL